jgi:hypothetical protein
LKDIQNQLNGKRMKSKFKKKQKRNKNKTKESTVIRNRRHVIVDYSNLSIAVTGFSDRSQRICDRSLISLLNTLNRKDSAHGLRVLATSFTCTPQDKKLEVNLKKCWESAGFHVTICPRHENGGEYCVDEFLHAQAMDIILSRHRFGDLPHENTLVLCTGDGNNNNGLSNFVKVVQYAVFLQWKVEIWSWIHTRSHHFHELHFEYPELVSIHDLDDHADRLIIK